MFTRVRNYFAHENVFFSESVISLLFHTILFQFEHRESDEFANKD